MAVASTPAEAAGEADVPLIATRGRDQAQKALFGPYGAAVRHVPSRSCLD